MAHVEKSIDVRAPVDEVFDTLSNFEELPNFMEGLREVRKVSPYRLHFVENWGGTRQEWDARITDSTTNRRLAWSSETGDRRETEIVLEPLGRNSTRVYYAFDYEPRGVAASREGRGGTTENRVIGDLRRMKSYIESDGDQTGGERRMGGERRVGGGRTGGENRAGDAGREIRGKMMDTAEAGKQTMKSMVKTPKLNPFEWASASLLTIGGLNWALEGIFDFDLIDEVFDEDSITAKVLYGLIGASAVYTMFGLVRSDVMTRKHEQEHKGFEDEQHQPEFERRQAYV
ncbi:MAG TPA: DUF378 domain-containing protein [Dehalococcoidia bacterium]|nr:DUF378 domain-containing protein [Dehalococcoidia bacterium]